jgi:sodium-dependent dicarboxylate transporter 2/3/5
VVLLAAAGTSMWLSNVAAAALLLVALQPLLASSSLEPAFRRALLLALAIGANLGGMATPIGSGPNAIAIAATRATHPITFIRWMSFGVPIVLGMLGIGLAMLVLRYRVRGQFELTVDAPERLSRRALLLIGIFGAAVVAWISEPLHHVAAPLVALTLMLSLFATGLLRKADLGALDWATLGLIAGGLGLGRLLESTGVLTDLAGALALADYPRWLWLGGLVLMSASLAAIMSNTATAALLIPLGLLLDASASTAIIVAVATSFGMPLPISTPPNAMAYGAGGLRVADLLQIGLPLMILGCLLVTLTGTWFLALLGLG